MNLEQIVEIPEESRDAKWESDFLTALTKGAKVIVLSDKPIPGPDGLPYLMVDLALGSNDDLQTKTASAQSLPSQPLENVLMWLCDNGIGLVINPQKSVPDYVFPYGMLWNWRQTGSFISPADTYVTGLSGSVQFKNGEEILVGPPSLDYLPQDVREILKEFFLADFM